MVQQRSPTTTEATAQDMAQPTTFGHVVDCSNLQAQLPLNTTTQANVPRRIILSMPMQEINLSTKNVQQVQFTTSTMQRALQVLGTTMPTTNT